MTPPLAPMVAPPLHPEVVTVKEKRPGVKSLKVPRVVSFNLELVHGTRPCYSSAFIFKLERRGSIQYI